MSHGATSRVAKLALESTTFPLLTSGCSISAGFAGVASTFLVLMRDVVDGTGGSGSTIDASDSWDNLRLFLEVPFPMTAYGWNVLLEEPLDASLSELEECDEVEPDRVGCGITGVGDG